MLAVAVLGTAAQAANAAFTVRRTTSPATVDLSAPVATVQSSPYDDAPARLADGENYYYAVLDAAGRSVPVAALRNGALGCLRLSFDDGNPASAPVSATQSSLTVAPSSVRADGLQAAIATIVPRDGNGVLLGRGLTVTVDASLLWPGRLDAPVEDLGDGSYRARIVSDVPGRGMVDVAVEGVSLFATPTLDFTPLDPEGSLRDLAILRLRDMTAAGSRFADLLAAAGSGSAQAEGIQDAWTDASQALQTLANGDTSHDDNVLKSGLDEALKSLAPLLDRPGALDPADVQDLMNDLLDTARLVAAYHLDLAARGCGACAGGSPRKVCEAGDALDAADALRESVRANWSDIVDGYARSVALSLQAEHGC